MEELRRILFVDDEPKVLQGLRRMLRSMRREWDMDFIESGEAALEVMKEKKYHVVVSDMRMPGMDGAALLKKIKEEYPQTVRIILSGHSDRDMIMESVMPTHQYLSKPCDPELLKATINRACTLLDLLADERIKSMVTQLETLPSLPTLYKKIQEELLSSEPSMNKIKEIIEEDIGMSAKILQLVNSAFFGIPQHVSSPSQAVVLLGLEIVKSLVLSIHIFSQFDQEKIKQCLSIEKLWNHSRLVGNYSKEILGFCKADRKISDFAFLAGMMHDIGKIILAVNLPEDYKKVKELTEEEKMPCHKAEQRVFNLTHAEIGAYLLGLWGLPNPVIEAVAFHHTPEKILVEEPDAMVGVYVANFFAGKNEGLDEEDAGEVMNLSFLEQLGIADRINEWYERLNSNMEKAVNE